MTDDRRLAQYEDERDPAVFWAAVRPADEPLRHRWFLPAVLTILVFSVPWYLPSSVGDRLVGGLPVWTWVTILCGLALAMVTSYASLRLWRDGSDESGGEDGASAQAREQERTPALSAPPSSQVGLGRDAARAGDLAVPKDVDRSVDSAAAAERRAPAGDGQAPT